ncbi:hypothetical protein Acor_83650 [Acrocarpospora corrugata]|uniref:Uncharacterized protein n=1 Tax=Acrocarpospora corrugata TaxID=35763 RepID=A0A5M3WBT7_9ACTN|nr:hypothetical protein Acor_83650 [Acrocarpospora corrugata]
MRNTAGFWDVVAAGVYTAMTGMLESGKFFPVLARNRQKDAGYRRGTRLVFQSFRPTAKHDGNKRGGARLA